MPEKAVKQVFPAVFQAAGPQQRVLEWTVQRAAEKGQPFPSPWLRMFQNAREWCDRS